MFKAFVIIILSPALILKTVKIVITPDIAIEAIFSHKDRLPWIVDPFRLILKPPELFALRITKSSTQYTPDTLTVIVLLSNENAPMTVANVRTVTPCSN